MSFLLSLFGSYKYPTHIDCFENLILQLHGRKLVRLLPPSAVADVRPDPTCKHWPSGEAEEVAAAHAARGLAVELEAGDALYVPLMWFHAVEVLEDGNGTPAWSATANQYFFLEGDSGVRWRRHIEGRKVAPWVEFEEANGVALC